MGHKVAEAIIENGQLVYVDNVLPKGRMVAHIIYDVEDAPHRSDIATIVRETAGIYSDVDAHQESTLLRASWERNVKH